MYGRLLHAHQWEPAAKELKTVQPGEAGAGQGGGRQEAGRRWGRCSFPVAPWPKGDAQALQLHSGYHSRRQLLQGHLEARGARPEAPQLRPYDSVMALSRTRLEAGWTLGPQWHLGVQWGALQTPGGTSWASTHSHRAPVAQSVCTQRRLAQGSSMNHHCFAAGLPGQPPLPSGHPSIPLDFIPQLNTMSLRHRKQKNLLTVFYNILEIPHPPNILWM